MENDNFAGIKACDSLKQLALLFLFITVCAVAASLLGLAVFNKLLKLNLDYLEVTSFMQGLAYIFLCLLTLKKYGVDLAAAGREWRADLGRDVKLAFKYFGVYLVITGVIVLIVFLTAWFFSKPAAEIVGKVASPDTMYAAVRTVMGRSDLRFFFLLVGFCVLAPVGEELFFRRLLYASLRKKSGFLPVLFFSSAVFAAAHLGATLMVFPVGLLLGYVYEKHRRLPVNIMLHALVNLFATIVHLT
ncbi:MAG: CPBP family intramembrane metalloprotease [Elusimicrobia bacterium]|nr:CPBP family intramembrane metalloprotease [Elusimicrobiota bacterium]